MSYGAGGGDQPIPPGGMLASEGDRERTQGVLKQAFEDQRLTQDEFESRGRVRPVRADSGRTGAAHP
jgi:hypothetical protein